MTKLKLWIAPGSCALAQHIVIRETGLDYELVELNLRSGIPDDVRKLNPKGKVPILQLDGEIITEGVAISTALSQLVPEKNLMGKTNLDKVRVIEWFNWASGQLHQGGFTMIFRSNRFTAEESALDGVKAKAKENVFNYLKTAEDKLTGPHAVGDSFTAADAFLFVFYRWGNVIGINMEAEFPKYTALVNELIKRESVQEAIKREDIPILGVKA